MHSAAMDVCDGGREAGGIAMEGKKAPNKQERVGDFLKSLEIHSSIVLQEDRQMEPIKLEGIGLLFKFPQGYLRPTGICRDEPSPLYLQSHISPS